MHFTYDYTCHIALLTEASVWCAVQYRAVAARGAMLFFLLNSLNKIHAFYQYSLNAFVTVFSRAIDVAPGEPCLLLSKAELRCVIIACSSRAQDCAALPS